MGHLARSCPENPRGLYPQGINNVSWHLKKIYPLNFCFVMHFKGGGCKFCGSVEHLKRDCPQVARKKIKGNMNGL